MKILIVEDSEIVRESMQKFLRSNGYNVRVAADALSAWRVLRDDRDINFLIVDWNLPGMNGIELVRKVRTIKSRDFYILFVTANSGAYNLKKAIENGADDFIPKPYDLVELLARIVAGERIILMLKDRRELAKSASRASGKMERLNKVLKFRSDRDHDTGLYNRRGVKGILNKFTMLERRSKDLSLIVIDVDRFKFINDTYGHDVGDTVIKSIAGIIKKVVGKDALVARWGGDEFLVLRLGSTTGMETLAEWISDKVSLKIFPQGIRMSITTGIASGKTLNFREVFLDADKKMLQAKKTKKASRE